MAQFKGSAADIETNKNKVSEIKENSNESQYPSVPAVVKFVNTQLENASTGKKGNFSVWQPYTEYKVGDMVIADNAVTIHYTDIQGVEQAYGCNESVIAECVTGHTSKDVFEELDETEPFNPVQLWKVYSIQSVRNGKDGYLDNAFDISLFATRNEVKEYVGEIDTALDAIINIQNSILGFPEAEETTF